VVPIPSGVGFCMAIPTAMINEVRAHGPGVRPRLFGKRSIGGLRSHTMGYRSVLAPSTFVYHAGAASRRSRVSLATATRSFTHTRRSSISATLSTPRSSLRSRPRASSTGCTSVGLRRIVISAARQQGYRLETSRLHQQPDEVSVVRFRIDPDGSGPTIKAAYEGFETDFTVGEGGVLSTVTSIVGQPPREISDLRPRASES